ncbi:MAG: hypothetical protein QNJ45_07095 [Ardenticatenaceae bacterium]|nr:hypothetical protein [Ardenticatenaceae bacterium]
MSHPPITHHPTPKSKRFELWAALPYMLPVLVAVVAYWPILSLPNIYDTLLHTQLADDLTLGTLWLPNEDFGFYRPLVFLPLVLLQNLVGYPAGFLQLLNLGQHALNVWLLTILVRRLGGRREPALIAGLLFALFPFGYQALAIYGNNAYLTVTGAILLGLLLTLTDLPRRRLIWAAAAVQLAGFLVHETAGLMLGLVVIWIGLRLQTTDHRPQRGFLKSVVSTLKSFWPVAMVWVGYLLFYMALPRGGGPLLDYGGNALWPKLLLFLQTLGYPFAWFAHIFPNLSAQFVILFSVILTVGLALWAWWRLPEMRSLLLWGFGWWVAASLLVGITLPTYYIADGARLLYPGAAGLAIFWGVLLSPKSVKRPDPVRWVLLGGLAFVLLSGGRFIRQMIGYYQMVSEPVKTLKQELGGRFSDPSYEDAILVNLPQWVSPPRNTYAIGTEFAPFMGDHLFAAELLQANGIPFPLAASMDISTEVTILNVPDLRSETPYNLGLYTLLAEEAVPIDAGGRVFVSKYDEDGIQTIATGFILSAADDAADSAAGSIGPYTFLSGQAQLCDGRLEVNLTLQPEAEIPSTLSLFVQAVGDNGVIDQADGPPLDLPPGRIEGNRRLRDLRLLDVGDQVPAAVLVGAYDFTSGVRFPAVDQWGEAQPENAWVVPVEACR